MPIPNRNQRGQHPMCQTYCIQAKALMNDTELVRKTRLDKL